MDDFLSKLLRLEPAPHLDATLAEFFAEHCARITGVSDSLERALIGGLSADRLGYAFVAGYHAALHRLVPGLELTAQLSLCATESGGVHPRAIKTRLAPAGEGFQLDGEKVFVTLGNLATELLVVATSGEQAGQNRLKLVRVPAGAHGVSIHTLPELPFAPEVPHARLELLAVRVPASAVLAGDGYSDYLKPFRSVEDLHVHAALLGYLISLGRRFGWSEASLESALCLVAAARNLGAMPALSPALHLGLAGLFSAAETLCRTVEPEFSRVSPAERERWVRDQGLLGVASRARHERRQRAWQAFKPPAGDI